MLLRIVYHTCLRHLWCVAGEKKTPHVLVVFCCKGYLFGCYYFTANFARRSVCTLFWKYSVSACGMRLSKPQRIFHNGVNWISIYRCLCTPFGPPFPFRTHFFTYKKQPAKRVAFSFPRFIPRQLPWIGKAERYTKYRRAQRLCRRSD